VYPAPANAEGPGAVFTVSHGEKTSVWIVVDQDQRSIRYARVEPGHSAGTVRVAVLNAGASETRLRVSYEMTALGPEGADWLEGFVAGFDDYIAHWSSAIAAAIEPEHAG